LTWAHRRNAEPSRIATVRTPSLRLLK
jgi:hypothetical protein